MTTKTLTISSGHTVDAGDYGMMSILLAGSARLRDVRITAGDGEIVEVEVAGFKATCPKGGTWPDVLAAMAPTPPNQYVFVKVENRGKADFFIGEIVVESVDGSEVQATGAAGPQRREPLPGEVLGDPNFDPLAAVRQVLGGDVQEVTSAQAVAVEPEPERVVSVRADEQAIVLPVGIAHMIVGALNAGAGAKVSQGPRFAFLAALDNAPDRGACVTIGANEVVLVLTDEQEDLRPAFASGRLFLMDEELRTRLTAKFQRALAWSWNEPREEVPTAPPVVARGNINLPARLLPVADQNPRI